MSLNKRIFYATQSINLQPVSTGSANPVNYRVSGHYTPYGGWIQPLGLQSAGITTTFNNEPISQLGTLAIYSQQEASPEVEVTLSKLIDGTAPLYSICTAKIDPGATTTLKTVNKDIVEVSTNMVNVRFGVAADTDARATGILSHHTLCERMYLSNVSFTMPVDGNATEQITLVGSNKTWGGSVTVPSQGTLPLGEAASLVVRRQNVAISGTNGTSSRGADNKLLVASLPSTSIIPTGIRAAYLGRTLPNGTPDTPKIQNITVSANLNRENINELGFFGPYFKYTTFPIEVTSEFQVVSVSGDFIKANDFECFDNTDTDMSSATCNTKYTNTDNEEIVIKICGATDSDSLYLDLGKKNKLTSINYTGGDTGGGNTTVTYSYQTFNKFNVIPVGSYAGYASHTGGTTYASGTLST